MGICGREIAFESVDGAKTWGQTAMSTRRGRCGISTRRSGRLGTKWSVPMFSRWKIIPCMDKIWAAVALMASMHAATKIVSGDFGKTREGAATRIYTLTNKSGVEVKITSFGGRVVSLKVPDKTGAMGDVVLGLEGGRTWRKSSVETRGY